MVVATGYEQNPLIPGWPGRETFEGELIHSSEYRNAEPFVGRSALVVGPGCSGMEIANELVEGGASEVRLAVRTPPHILLREGPGPLPGDLIAVILWHLPTRVADRIARFASRMDIGDLSDHGLRAPEEGLFSRAKAEGKAPAIVDPRRWSRRSSPAGSRWSPQSNHSIRAGSRSPMAGASRPTR